MPQSPQPQVLSAAERPARGEVLELEIEDLVYGGRGLAHRDGYVVFVAGGLPGDRLRAEVTKAKRNFAEARSVELLQPSPDRLPEQCVHGGEPCPGAPWQSLPYELQLGHKQRQVRDALERIGGLEGFDLEEVEPAVEQWRYRNKLEYSFGEREDGLALGFHARGRWDLIVDAQGCLLGSERSNAVRDEVREWADREGIPAYDRREGVGVLRNLVVREGRRTGQVQTRLVTSPAAFARPPVDLHTVIDGPAGGTDGPTGVLGSERLEEEVCGLRFELSHGAFFQTNTEMAERLYGIAGEFASLTGN